MVARWAAGPVLALLLAWPVACDSKCSDGDFREALQDRLGEDVHKYHPVRPECPRLERLPTKDEFDHLRRIGQPIVFGNGWDVFGEKIAGWRDLREFDARHGQQVVRAAIFDTTRAMDNGGDERFSTEPVEDGRYLRSPHIRHWTLSQVMHYNETNRMAFVEQGVFYHAEADEVDNNQVEYLLAPKDQKPRLGEDTKPMYADWRPPAFAPHMWKREVNVWLGRLPAGAPKKESPTHYDPADNLMLQLRGTKTWHLYHGYDAANIYPRNMRKRDARDPDVPGSQPRDYTGGDLEDQTQDNFSPVDATRPDFERWPRSQRAKGTICKTMPGDVLFMPAFTWHHVVNEGEHDDDPIADGMSLGVNVWFAGEVRFQRLFDSVMALLQGGRLNSENFASLVAPARYTGLGTGDSGNVVHEPKERDSGHATDAAPSGPYAVKEGELPTEQKMSVRSLGKHITRLVHGGMGVPMDLVSATVPDGTPILKFDTHRSVDIAAFRDTVLAREQAILSQTKGRKGLLQLLKNGDEPKLTSHADRYNVSETQSAQLLLLLLLLLLACLLLPLPPAHSVHF